MNGLVLVCAAVLIVCATSFAMAGEMIHDATTQESDHEDARFTHVYSKDHPADFKPDYADKAAWERRADFLRHQVLVALGLWPMPPKTPLNPVIHSKIDRDGYTIEKVFFASMPGHYVSGNLYRPKGRGGKLPGMLCPYGHWPNGRFIWNSEEKIDQEMESGAEQTPEGARTPLQARCAMLARMGCVVFQYDMVGYGDSRKLTHPLGFTDAEAVLRLQSFMGLQTWNSIRSLDFLQSLPDVDPNRIGVTGASSGGTQTIMLSVVDARPAVAFPAVMVSMNMQGGCICENAPLLRVGTNNVELASLFAPKPEGMAAANDWTHDFLIRGLPEMRSVWRLYGAEDEVEGQHFPFPHNANQLSREMMYNFVNEHLKLGWQPPVAEQPFVPVPPAELSVYDNDHPVPADALDAAGLRREMISVSDKQLEALAKNPSDYAKTLRVALQAMVVDSLPDPADVQVIESHGAAPGTAGEWNAVITRRGAAERLPVRAIFPQKWDGSITIWSHPDGCRSLTDDAGKAVPAAQTLLDHGAAVLAVDCFMSGGFVPKPKPPATQPAATKSKPNAAPPYIAFTIGYNRSILANRVHDLLSAIALAKATPQTRSIRLIAFGEAGISALLARALANDAIDRAAIDLNRFDFDQIHSEADPMLLPGALKYGGISGFLPLCSHGQTLLTNARHPAPSQPPAEAGRVTWDPKQTDVTALAQWLTK